MRRAEVSGAGEFCARELRAVPPPPAAAPPAAPPPPAAAASTPSTGAPPPTRRRRRRFDERAERRHRGRRRRPRQRRYSAAPPCRPGGTGCSRDWTWSARFGRPRRGRASRRKPSARKMRILPVVAARAGDGPAPDRRSLKASIFARAAAVAVSPSVWLARHRRARQHRHGLSHRRSRRLHDADVQVPAARGRGAASRTRRALLRDAVVQLQQARQGLHARLRVRGRRGMAAPPRLRQAVGDADGQVKQTANQGRKFFCCGQKASERWRRASPWVPTGMGTCANPLTVAGNGPVDLTGDDRPLSNPNGAGPSGVNGGGSSRGGGGAARGGGGAARGGGGAARGGGARRRRRGRARGRGGRGGGRGSSDSGARGRQLPVQARGPAHERILSRR